MHLRNVSLRLNLYSFISLIASFIKYLYYMILLLLYCAYNYNICFSIGNFGSRRCGYIASYVLLDYVLYDREEATKPNLTSSWPLLYSPDRQGLKLQ